MNLYHSPIFHLLRKFARAVGLTRLAGKILPARSYELEFATALQSAVKPHDVVWDVGANVGLYTLQFADWADQEGRVVAFEPLDSAFQQLQVAVVNSPLAGRIQLRTEALSNVPGRATLAIDPSAQGISTTGHLKDDRDPADDAKSTSKSHVTVTTVDLMVDSLVAPAPNVTKIDVEGFEEEVLLGGRGTFSGAQSRHVFIEVHFARLDERNRGDAPARMVRLLKDWGYRVRWADPSHLHASRSAS